MIAHLRLAAALAAFAVVAPALVLLQALVRLVPGCDGAALKRIWCRFVLFLLGVRVTVKGRMAKARPLLIAANHVSWVDIMVLASLEDVAFIAKHEVASWPLIGPLARMQHTVFVDRSARRRSASQADEIAARLDRGKALVLFAEGTSADGNRVLPFNSTLFAAAAPARPPRGAPIVTVQPAAIAYTRLHGLPMGRHLRSHAAWIGDQTLVPHVLQLLRRGALDVEVHFGTPIHAAGKTRKAIALAAETEVRAMMAAALHPAPRR